MDKRLFSKMSNVDRFIRKESRNEQNLAKMDDNGISKGRLSQGNIRASIPQEPNAATIRDGPFQRKQPEQAPEESIAHCGRVRQSPANDHTDRDLRERRHEHHPDSRTRERRETGARIANARNESR